MPQEPQFKELVMERFKKLPKVVQNAIVSADVSQHLRTLADTHKLHLDQWESLENEVQYTLLGIQPAEELADHIQKNVGVDADTAKTLAAEISRIVFQPIREELERQLEHPEAQAEQKSGVDQVRAQVLADSTAPTTPAAPTVVPATPPPPPPTAKVERAPLPSGYAGAASHERKSIEGDPYREQIA